MAATMHCKNLVSESAILAIPSFVLFCLVALKEEAGDATQEEEKRDLCLYFFTLQNASCWGVQTVAILSAFNMQSEETLESS